MEDQCGTIPPPTPFGLISRSQPKRCKSDTNAPLTLPKKYIRRKLGRLELAVLAPLEGTSNEHKVGANIFRNAELVFQFSTAMRFTDETLSQILEAMRTPGGRKLSRGQWQALVKTERSAEQPADASAERPDEANC